jgi:hypothetical protein
VPAALIIGNDKGGVGKDLVTELIVLALLMLGYSPKIVEVEIERRMAAKFPDGEFIATGAVSAEELYARPDLVFAPLDHAATLIKSNELVVMNLGASLTTSFLKWSAGDTGKAFFGPGDQLHFVCPLTMQVSALRTGLANLAAFKECYPAARRTAVLNSFSGEFMEGDRNVERALEAAKGSAGQLDVVRLERMNAPAWGYMVNLGRLDEVVANKSWKDLVALGLPDGPSIRSMALLENWLKRSILALQPILSVPGADEGKGKGKGNGKH